MTKPGLHTIASKDSEASLLGAILADPAQIDQIVADGLRADHFSHHLHRRAWRAAVELRAEDVPIDEISLWQRIQATGGTRDEQLRELAGWSAAPGALGSHAEYHATQVRRLARLRDLHLEGLRLAEACVAPGADPVAIIERASDALDEAAPVTRTERKAGAIMAQVWDRLAARSVGDVPEGLKTGLKPFDELHGALQASRLYVLAARPGMGKTSLALQVALKAAESGPVYVASLEMSAEDLIERAVALLARLDATLLREGTMGDWQWPAIQRAAQQITKLPLFIDDAANVTPAELKARVRAFARKHGQPALVVVDYLQRLSSPDTGTKNRAERVGEGSWACKSIAKQHRAPVLLLSQLNRACEQRSDKRPLLSDLRESGDIEQDADAVLAVYRDAYYHAESAQGDDAEIILLKNRHGSTGTASVRFVANQMRFE